MFAFLNDQRLVDRGSSKNPFIDSTSISARRVTAAEAPGQRDPFGLIQTVCVILLFL